MRSKFLNLILNSTNVTVYLLLLAKMYFCFYSFKALSSEFLMTKVVPELHFKNL
jgi:hypothetical protein